MIFHGVPLDIFDSPWSSWKYFKMVGMAVIYVGEWNEQPFEAI